MPKRESEDYVRYTIIVLAVVLVILFIFLFLQYRNLRRSQVIEQREAWISAVLKDHEAKGPLTASDINIVRPWMTFDYVNKLFNIPSNYLATALTISDPYYPQVSIGAYAKNKNIDVNIFLNQVDVALNNY